MTEVKVNYDLLLNKQIEIQLKSRSSVGGVNRHAVVFLSILREKLNFSSIGERT